MNTTVPRIPRHVPSGRIPPSTERIEAPEAEAALIGCMLMNSTCIARTLTSGIKPDAFAVPAHRLVAEKIFELSKSHSSIDLLILAEELRRTGQFDEVGMPLLLELTATIPTTVQFVYFLDRVREVWALRRMVLMCRSYAQQAFEIHAGASDGADAAAVVSKAARSMNRVADFLSRQNSATLRERLERRLESTLAAASGCVDRSRWLYTGLRSVDDHFLPFDVRQEDWYVIVGGPPSGGKSSVMRQFAMNFLDEGKRGAVFLLETGLRWVEAAAASRARVNLREIHAAPADQVAKFKHEYEILMGHAEKNLWIFEDLRNVEDIERTIREIHRNLREEQLLRGVPEEKARGLDFVLIDYLQIMRTKENFRGNRQQEVAHMSMSLKQCFKGLDITGFVGAQITRSSRDEGAPPTLSALRESGAIEQDADRVIFVHTPKTNRAGVEQDGTQSVDEVHLIQRKSRNGPRDVVAVVEFRKRFTVYSESIGPGTPRPGLPKGPNGYKRQEITR